MENAISKRQIDFEELNVDVQDAAMVKTIEETLSSKDEVKQLFAFEIIEGLPLFSWKSTISELFETGSEDVRKRILTLAWDEESIITNERLVEAIKKNDAVSADAVLVSGRRKLVEILSLLENLLESDSAEIRTAAAAAIIEIDGDSSDRAVEILDGALQSSDALTQSNALRRLENNEKILPDSKLEAFLKEENILASNAALLVAEKRKKILSFQQ